MKFILVSPERVNVYLTKDDIVIENIDIDDLYKSNFKIETKLQNILLMAKNITGFNKDSNKYEIDVIPMLGGEVLLSISTIDETKEQIFSGGKSFCYFSDDFETVIEILLNLDSLYTGETDVYLYGGKYYILIKIYKIETKKINTVKAVLTEYAEKSEIRDIIIKEHGKEIMTECAVETAKMYFS